MLSKVITAVPWWTIALIVVIARLAIEPNWPMIAALALLLVRHGLRNILAHRNKQHLLSDTARLAQLETEVRSISQAITFKNIRG